jgi:CheY-like chemotaxis protein
MSAAPQPRTVLVVDDEEMILEIAQAILESGGFRVLCASDGASALQLLAGPDSRVDVVLLDERMPGMDGHLVLAELRRNFPHLPVILSSGQGGSSSPTETPGTRATFLRKPYRSAALLEAVRSALASS